MRLTSPTNYAMNKDQPAFDVRVPLKRRNMKRLIITPLFASLWILLGTYLLPEDALNLSRIDSPTAFTVWDFLGVIFIGTGVVTLFKAAAFARRSLNTVGEWHFRLDNEYLIWDVPNHAHGQETGFRSALSDITGIEERYIHKHEAVDETEYWAHFHNKPSIQLQRYSGISLPWLISEISKQGVTYNKTNIHQ
ncbi:hypothetical protein [Kordiimonas laminariae]|uniref:hypothetical protein n=1 Tax=Kordiimonas laminariae TaxID=2917717 RepID=UPI001FF55E42|nr:hypothetical protein [Kordiimonas laminariae]MCK0069430.1 hypothetical protein [Kordiimonas laminariae]